MITAEPVDRGDKPSCSSFERYSLCAGSFQIAQLVPKEESGPAAQLGTDVHLALSGGKVDLTEEGEELYNLCRYHLEKMQDEVIGKEVTFQSLVEQRLWWKGEWSGQSDRIDIFQDSALVVDYKTGRGEVTPADRNMQLRGLAVLVKRRFPTLKKVYVAIIAPRSIGTTLACYDEEGLAAATEEVLELVAEISKEHAPRTPAPEACKNCPAKAVCPEVADKAITLPNHSHPPALTNQKLGELLVAAEYIEDYIMAIRIEAKSRLALGVRVPGWTTKEGRTTRSIGDATAAYNLVADMMSPEEFAGACKVSVPSLEKAYAKSTGLKGKAAKESFESVIAPVLETKTGEPILTKEASK